MRFRPLTFFVLLILCLAPPVSWADLAPYSQDFEGLDAASGTALGDAGWTVFGNVFGGPPNFPYFYGYGPFPAPNGTPGFSSIAVGAGGPDQGDQQMVVYSDYNNLDHAFGNYVEANVFVEQIVGAADVGTTWRFEWDAKRGDIAGVTTATAFFKTIDPNSNFALTNFITADMTNLPMAWGRYSLEIYIDPGLVGQFLQFGFLNFTTRYEFSGVLYDNVDFGLAPIEVDLDIKPGGCPNPINARSRGLTPAAVLGTADLNVHDIDVSSLRLEGLAPHLSSYNDVATPAAGGSTCDCTTLGPDGWDDLTLKFDTQDLLAAIGSTGSGVVALQLTGNLLNGTPIEGVDCMLFVGGSQDRSSIQREQRRAPRDWMTNGNASGPVVPRLRIR